ncbi:MAG: Trm112 family protein, partial [Gammaproteobacteria bacterium]
MDKRLLDIVCCPVTKLPLQLLDSERLSRLNSAISNSAIGNGKLQNRAALAVKETLSEALVTRDGRLVYPVREGIPLLL